MITKTVAVHSLFLFSTQGKFSVIPSVFVTAAHHHAGLKRDAASVWIEDVTQSSFKVCLRELQNYAGSHEDVYVVSVQFTLVMLHMELKCLYYLLSVYNHHNRLIE